MGRKRLFICADRSFPRGDAGANRILYMSKALQEQGWKVVVVSIGQNRKEQYDAESDSYWYVGVEYRNIETAKNGFLRTIEHNLFDGNQVVRIMKRFHPSAADRVLLYSSSLLFSKNVINYAKKMRMKIACDIVEWHQPFQFKKGESDLRYKLYKKFFYDLVPECKNIIAISNQLEQHFMELHCHTVRIPIYIDADNRTFPQKSADGERIHLIYPGNPYRKDNLLTMLQGIDALTIYEKKKIMFHLTGVSAELLRNCIPGHEDVLERLEKEKVVVIHSWMEYEELLRLYSIIDFALIARDSNIVTMSNFPSKIPELFNRGIPVITNAIGDIANYLEDGIDSILVSDESVPTFTEAIRYVLSLKYEERMRMRLNAFESAYRKFNYHQCGAPLANFLEQML